MEKVNLDGVVFYRFEDVDVLLLGFALALYLRDRNKFNLFRDSIEAQ